MDTVIKKIRIDQICLDYDNPRIKQFLEIYGGSAINSEQVALALMNPGNSDGSNSYNILKESIKVSEGIIHPIIVNREANGKYVVIEGNTRLQIYKEFNDSNPSGPWAEINCIVYDDLPKNKIHSIRLQSHLVGPRDWDPYSKAKYLHTLSNVELLPMTSIISQCGGNAREINNLIRAYCDMQEYYLPLVEKNGGDFDIRQFSKFVEMQNGSITREMAIRGYGKKDFAEWVVKGNIDKALNVRQLPEVLKNEDAKKEFLRTNISNAIKRLALSQANEKGLKNYSYDILAMELISKLKDISYSEVKSLKDDDLYKEKRNVLFNLYSELDELIKDLIIEE